MKRILAAVLFAGAFCLLFAYCADNEDRDQRIRSLVKDFELGWNDNKAKLAKDELVKIGKPAVPYLEESLDHSNREVRWISTITLGRLEARKLLLPSRKLSVTSIGMCADTPSVTLPEALPRTVALQPSSRTC